MMRGLSSGIDAVMTLRANLALNQTMIKGNRPVRGTVATVASRAGKNMIWALHDCQYAVMAAGA